MGRFERPEHIAPTGEHARTEVMWRITTPDGRISDHGPYVVGPNTPLISLAMTFRRPPGSVVTKLVRTVTTTATDWQPVDDASEGSDR